MLASRGRSGDAQTASGPDGDRFAQQEIRRRVRLLLPPVRAVVVAPLWLSTATLSFVRTKASLRR